MKFRKLTRIDKYGAHHEIFVNLANIAWLEDDHGDESQPRCKIVQANGNPPLLVAESAQVIIGNY